MNRTPNVVGLGLIALLAGFGSVACGASASSNDATENAHTLQPVDAALAAKAQASCWFKVKNRTSKGDEVRLWNASSSTGATTERLGQLLIVNGAMEPSVHDSRYYACSLYEYTKGSPVVMSATSSPMPVPIDNVIPYGFARDGHKELK